MDKKQSSTLSSAIYRNMQLKETDELLQIWMLNDREEWSDEAFSIVHDILVERTGDAPSLKTNIKKRRRYKKKKRNKGKQKTPQSLFTVLYLTVFLILLPPLLLYLVPPKYNGLWVDILAYTSLAFSFWIPGFYFGWKSWFQSAKTKQEISNNLPNMKKATWGLYGLGTFFLPDCFVPTYLLLILKFTSLALLLFGIKIIQLI
ncbi:MAG: hypothetical protein GY755_15770 [Chloroflexi bacterium]|nr:hypothetical protein [Chloroflexota bacterium]